MITSPSGLFAAPGRWTWSASGRSEGPATDIVHLRHDDKAARQRCEKLAKAGRRGRERNPACRHAGQRDVSASACLRRRSARFDRHRRSLTAIGQPAATISHRSGKDTSYGPMGAPREPGNDRQNPRPKTRNRMSRTPKRSEVGGRTGEKDEDDAKVTEKNAGKNEPPALFPLTYPLGRMAASQKRAGAAQAGALHQCHDLDLRPRRHPRKRASLAGGNGKIIAVGGANRHA